MRKLLKRHGRHRVIVTEKLRSYGAANNELGLNVEHRQHKGLSNRAENSHQSSRVREKVMRYFKSARQLQRIASVHGQVSNLFMGCRYNDNAQHKCAARVQAFAAWERASCARMAAKADPLPTPIAPNRPPAEQLDNTARSAIWGLRIRHGRTIGAVRAAFCRVFRPVRWRSCVAVHREPLTTRVGTGQRRATSLPSWITHGVNAVQ
jgi:hypothetical protein